MNAVYLNGTTREKREIDLFDEINYLYDLNESFHICNVKENEFNKILFYDNYGFECTKFSYIGIYNPVYRDVYFKNKNDIGEYIYDGVNFIYDSRDLSFLKSSYTFELLGGNRIYTTLDIDDIKEFYSKENGKILTHNKNK